MAPSATATDAVGTRIRVVAVLTVRNEARFLGACLDNLIGQGVQVYVCDNGSTDDTRAIAEQHLGAGVLAVEHVPFDGTYRWEQILQRKEQIFQEVDADWVMHVDADEIHLPPVGWATIPDALTEADRLGFDAVEFDEFTFVPTVESPDHDHPDFERTLRTYYPFRPRSPHCVRAYRRHTGPIEIAWSGGHVVRFAHEP
ncbi:MAG: glycosyltransferase family 2 protein, partial [Ilumatobacteraceae bacterium]